MSLAPVDIANRACQHCGVTRISTTLGFAEDSKQSGEIGSCYDQLRRAELRRNVWQFAIRKAALRPIDTTTMFLKPALWSSTTTYGFGAIISDAANFLWQSRAQDNINNAPGDSAAWEAYCGPLSAQPYDNTGTTGYYAGELVYETPGDGSYVVYMSLISGNSQDPRQPNTWISTTQYSKDQVVLFYSAWAIGTTYAAGNGVTLNGISYISLSAGNVGNSPDTSPTKWVALPIALAPGYYSATTAYTVGQFVTYLGLNYVCIAASTGNLPTNTSFWAPQQATTFYVSLIDFNLNQLPSSAPALWAVGTTYAAGNTVGASDGNIYSSIGSGNIGHDPALTTGFWTNTGVLNPWTTVDPFGKAATSWAQLSVALTDLQFSYPIGTGPVTQTATRNVFRLPANFLRKAPQDPKAGSVSFLGAPAGLAYSDWDLTGNYIVSREAFPIVLRFVADITDVNSMDDLFREGLAARIASEVVEALTQSTAKRGGIMAVYGKAIGEARLVNGIETGSIEPAEDDYLQCRA